MIKASLPDKKIARQFARQVLRRTGTREVIASLYRRFFSERAFHSWISRVEKTRRELPIATGPMFSIIVPSHKYVERYMIELLESVHNQSYSNWELVVVNACDDPEEAKKLSNALRIVDRVREVKLGRNLHISANTNAGIDVANGDYIAFLDHDDILTSTALADIARVLSKNPEIDSFYSDEDKISDRGNSRFYPFFKPEFNEEQFLTSNYVCHFSVVRTTLVRKVAGIRVGFEGAQDYDFWLRLYDLKPLIWHIAAFSYHWRVAEGSTAGTVTEKSYASDAGIRALEDYLSRNRINAKVSNLLGQPSTYCIRYAIPVISKLFIISADRLLPESLKDGWQDIDIEQLTPSEFRMNEMDSDAYIIFAQAGVKLPSIGDVFGLLGKAAQPGVGIVSANVADSKGITRRGYVLQDDILVPVYDDYHEQIFEYDGLNCVPRPYLVVSDDLMAVSARVLREVMNNWSITDGFTDLCLRVFAQGYRNVYWPFAVTTVETNDRSRFSVRRSNLVASVPAQNDPYINPHLHVAGGKAVPKY